MNVKREPLSLRAKEAADPLTFFLFCPTSPSFSFLTWLCTHSSIQIHNSQPSPANLHLLILSTCVSLCTSAFSIFAIETSLKTDPVKIRFTFLLSVTMGMLLQFEKDLLCHIFSMNGYSVFLCFALETFHVFICFAINSNYETIWKLIFFY